MERTAPDARISVVVSHVSWVGIVAHSCFIPLFAWLGHAALAWFNVLSVAIWVGAALLNRSRRSTLAMWLLFAEVVAHATIATSTLGWESGFQYYLIPLIPFVMFHDHLKGRTVGLASLGVFAVFILLKAFAPQLALDGRVASLLTYSNIAIPFIALGLVTYYFRLASVTAEARMELMALTDSLTGLYNRRHMEGLLEEAKARYTRDGRPFCVIVADLDHFKEVNDTYGHDVGDKVLRAVASVFAEELRGVDAVARWGGEEFLVLLSETKLEDAVEVAHRLRSAAEEHLGERAGLPRKVTLTLGLAGYRRGTEISTLIKSADEALYAGKSSGRNRVVIDQTLAAVKTAQSPQTLRVS